MKDTFLKVLQTEFDVTIKQVSESRYFLMDHQELIESEFVTPLCVTIEFIGDQALMESPFLTIATGSSLVIASNLSSSPISNVYELMNVASVLLQKNKKIFVDNSKNKTKLIA